jgi:capsid portal protein
MQAVTDTSDAAVNIGTPLGINFAQYSTINKRLEIIGQGFTGKVQLIVNGKRSTRTVQILDAQTVVVAGKERKLQLRPGRNQIQLMVNGLRSATYVLML